MVLNDKLRAVSYQVSIMRQIGKCHAGRRSPNCCEARRCRRARVEFAWKTAVGSCASSKVTRGPPRRPTCCSWTRPPPQWAREIRRSSPIILRRLQALLGENAILELTCAPRGPRTSNRGTRGPLNAERVPVIVSAVRTPTGKFLGALKTFTAPQLGALVVAEAVRRAGIDPAIVDECIMGNVVSAGSGPEPGAPGGAQRRPGRSCRRAHHQQGLRLRA